MTVEHANEVAKIGVRLLDDAQMVWLAAERECDQALRHWLATSRQCAYAAYRAALDREEAAARDLQRLWEPARPCREALVDDETGVSER